MAYLVNLQCVQPCGLANAEACVCACVCVYVGDVKLSRSAEIAYTPLQPAWKIHYYVVTIDSMSVAGRQLDAPRVRDTHSRTHTHTNTHTRTQ